MSLKRAMMFAAIFWTFGLSLGITLGWVIYHEPARVEETRVCPEGTFAPLPQRFEFRLMCKTPEGKLQPCAST